MDTNSSMQSGCSVAPNIKPSPKSVSVNGVTISRAAIARETQNHPASKPIDAWQAAARALVIRELLLQEARRIAIKALPLTDEAGRRETDDEALVRALVEKEVATPEASEAECRRYYERNKNRFRSPNLYEVRHILVPAAPGNVAAREQGRVLAEILISDLHQDRSKFAAIAEQVSACPSARTGGSLGQIGPGQTVPEFEKALLTMPEGIVAPAPVETRYGFHVVLVERRVAGHELSFEAVQKLIFEWLNEKVQRTAVRQYISLLAGRAEIVGVELDSSRSPLVQ